MPYDLLHAELKRLGLTKQRDLHQVLETIETHAAEFGGALTTIQIRQLASAVRFCADTLPSPLRNPWAVERALLLALILGQQVAGKAATKVFGPAAQEKANREEGKARNRKTKDQILMACARYKTKGDAAHSLDMTERTLGNKLAELGTSWRREKTKSQRGKATAS